MNCGVAPSAGAVLFASTLPDLTSPHRQAMTDPDPKPTPSAPTPVRDLMPGVSGRVDEEDLEPSAAPDLSIEFEVEGESWVALSGGRTRSGTAPDSGALLLLVLFRRAADSEDEIRREAWTAARSLEELSPVQLSELLGRSRPFREVDPSGKGGSSGGRAGRQGSSGKRPPRPGR